MGQKHDAKWSASGQLKTRALHQHDFGFFKQLQKEILVILDRVNLGVELGEHVQSRTGFDAADTRESP
jgi:hypothetical protein